VTAREDDIARLYREYGPVLYLRCLRLLRDNEAARDATQDLFVKLCREPGLDGPVPRVLPFIYRVATHHCLNVLRDRARQQARLASFDVRDEAPSDLFPERKLSQQILSRFDAETQAIAVAVYVDGMEREEVASALGISSKTVRRRLERFIENARKFVERSEA